MSGTTPIKQLEHARAALARAEERTDAARRDLHEAIRGAVEAGEPINVIAHVAGRTRQRVWQLVNGK